MILEKMASNKANKNNYLLTIIISKPDLSLIKSNKHVMYTTLLKTSYLNLVKKKLQKKMHKLNP